MPEALRILLLEDDPDDAERIKRALERAALPTQLHVVSSRDPFKQALQESKPDVVLSDHSGGQFSALEALTEVRSIRPATPLILVTGAVNEGVVVESLKAGADDCIFKDRLDALGPAILTALAARQPLERLTSRQVEVLQLLVSGLSTRETARKLKLSIKTVETHRAAIMRRMGIRDVPGLVRYALRVGLVPPAP